MKVKVKCEPLGTIQNTAKGFIRQYLVIDAIGNKDVIKIFSRDAASLQADGPQEKLIETDNFCFIPNV